MRPRKGLLGETPRRQSDETDHHQAIPVELLGGLAGTSRSPGSEALCPRIPRSQKLRELEGCDCLRSEEHTSELQSRLHLVCRLLLEKKKNELTSSVAAHHPCP